MPTWILEQELAEPLRDRAAPSGYAEAVVLVRQRGFPLGTVRVACADGILRASALRGAIAADPPIARRLAARALNAWLLRRGGEPGEPHEDAARSAVPWSALPSWSVVVCTRERPDELRRCLQALLRLEAPAGEILVVDNAPSTASTSGVVAEFAAAESPHVLRYLREDRPGQNWARAAGARAASGEIVAYTDDDVIVDPRWVVGLLAEFVIDRCVGAVTGPALALELETEAQEIFERRGGFVRGWDRRVFESSDMPPAAASRVGAGANAAFRRDLLLQLRLFSHEMDGGTVAMSAGDTYAFYLVLAHGWRIVYTPDALVWHRHRRDLAALAQTLRAYSVGGFTLFLRGLVAHREPAALRLALEWLWYDHVRAAARLLLRRPSALPSLLVREYWRGVLQAPGAWWRATRRERRLLADDRAARVRDFDPRLVPGGDADGATAHGGATRALDARDADFLAHDDATRAPDHGAVMADVPSR
ncbi:MAG TPA: glycosyltransferase [Gemmatirosa sp.]|nr:glycosyltransferase [Gemmatirosa sp.]